MPRDDGFATADISVSLFDDPKLKLLWRETHDQGVMGKAVTLYVATVLESWKSGTRATAVSASPIWLDEPASLVPALVAAGLLTDDGRLPTKTWNSWFKPALTRRRNRQRSGSAGGNRKASNAKALLQREGSDALPDPSVLPSSPPSDPSAPITRMSIEPEDGLPHITPEVQQEAENHIGTSLFQASDKVQTDLDGLVERQGPERVIAAFPRVTKGLRLSWPQLVYGTRNLLEPIGRVTPKEVAAAEEAESEARAHQKRLQRTANEVAWFEAQAKGNSDAA